jgi:hypothetical protein
MLDGCTGPRCNNLWIARTNGTLVEVQINMGSVGMDAVSKIIEAKGAWQVPEVGAPYLSVAGSNNVSAKGPARPIRIRARIFHFPGTSWPRFDFGTNVRAGQAITGPKQQLKLALAERQGRFVKLTLRRQADGWHLLKLG